MSDRGEVSLRLYRAGRNAENATYWKSKLVCKFRSFTRWNSHIFVATLTDILRKRWNLTIGSNPNPTRQNTKIVTQPDPIHGWMVSISGPTSWCRIDYKCGITCLFVCTFPVFLVLTLYAPGYSAFCLIGAFCSRAFGTSETSIIWLLVFWLLYIRLFVIGLMIIVLISYTL